MSKTIVKFKAECKCGITHLSAVYIDMETEGQYKLLSCPGCGRDVYVKTGDLQVVRRRILEPQRYLNFFTTGHEGR